MAIKFEELRKYVARNVRLSICFEDGYYHDYLMMSDIPEQKYAGFYIYGVGMVDVEFSRDVYTALPEPEGECWCSKDDTMNPDGTYDFGRTAGYQTECGTEAFVPGSKTVSADRQTFFYRKSK